MLTNRRRTSRRRAFIQTYAFPSALRAKLRKHFDDEHQVDVALEGLREWYLASLAARGQMLGMPSRAVDIAWHEMILMTRTYHWFCDHAFGYYLHHAPEAVIDEPMEDGLARTLQVLEGQSPAAIAGVPLLFAVDDELGFADGYLWRAEEIDRLRSLRLNARAARRYADYSPHGHGCGGGGDGGGGGGGCGGGGCGGGG